MGRAACAPFSGGTWVPIKHNVAWAEAYLHTKCHLNPSNRLATIHQRHRQDKEQRRAVLQTVAQEGPLQSNMTIGTPVARYIWYSEERPGWLGSPLNTTA